MKVAGSKCLGLRFLKGPAAEGVYENTHETQNGHATGMKFI